MTWVCDRVHRPVAWLRNHVFTHIQCRLPARSRRQPAISFLQALLEDHHVLRVRRIPTDADDLVAMADGEVDELALCIEAFRADVLVAVLPGPRLHRLLELLRDAAAARVRGDGAEPVVEHAGLELEPDPEPDGALADPREQREHVGPRREPPREVRR